MECMCNEIKQKKLLCIYWLPFTINSLLLCQIKYWFPYFLSFLFCMSCIFYINVYVNVFSSKPCYPIPIIFYVEKREKFSFPTFFMFSCAYKLKFLFFLVFKTLCLSSLVLHIIENKHFNNSFCWWENFTFLCFCEIKTFKLRIFYEVGFKFGMEMYECRLDWKFQNAFLAIS